MTRPITEAVLREHDEARAKAIATGRDLIAQASLPSALSQYVHKLILDDEAMCRRVRSQSEALFTLAALFDWFAETMEDQGIADWPLVLRDQARYARAALDEEASDAPE